MLDHIKAGRAMILYHNLGLDKKDWSVAIITNARSEAMGKKDILKVECKIEDLDLDVLAFIDHDITINVIKDGEIYLENMHVSPYDQGNQFNHDPLRRRKLLLHKAEIVKLFSQTREKGWTLVPLKIYFKHGRAKLELALASGKHNYDKRQDLRKKADQRDIQRALKERQRD